MKRVLIVAALSAIAAWSGALTLDITKPEANPEAKGLGAVLVARTTACTDPAKSKIVASYVRNEGGALRRTALKVSALKTDGEFAVIGAVPAGSVIELAVTNPNYKNYEPRFLLGADAHGVQWTSMKKFYTTPPTDSEVKSMLGELE